MKKIIVDIFGADNGPEPIIKGSLNALEHFPELGLVFVGDRETVENYCTVDGDRIELIETSDFISNNENPQVIFTGRDESSIAMGYKRLKTDNDCIGMISAGSTGALLIGSICRLGLIKGLKTPALLSNLPLYNGRMVCLVDCGANVQATAKDLCRFAVMGNALSYCMGNSENPRVGLLSVGREDRKGIPLTLEAFELIKQQPLNFIGNVEGSDMVTGYADVIVADGFAGNILLKACEASGLVAKGVVEHIAKQFGQEDSEMVKAMSEHLRLSFDYNRRGGATFLGTAKPVIKMHGCATVETPFACIDQLLKLKAAGFDEKIKSALENMN